MELQRKFEMKGGEGQSERAREKKREVLSPND